MSFPFSSIICRRYVKVAALLWSLSSRTEGMDAMDSLYQDSALSKSPAA